MAVYGLSLALNKSELIILTKNRIENVMVNTKPVAKNPGVLINTKMNFTLGYIVRRTATQTSVAY